MLAPLRVPHVEQVQVLPLQLQRELNLLHLQEPASPSDIV